jgi:aryl-alcohol dehydrogenase-like predicted oxidoreductase
MERVLEAAAESGMGILIKEALANGRLTPRNQAAAFQTNKKTLHQIAQKYEVGIDAIALAFVLSRPWAHVVLSGAAVENHLTSNISAASILLNSEEINLLENMKMDTKEYWQERKELKWN